MGAKKQARLNAQQLSKVEGFLRCFQPHPGHKLVHTDFTALEPKVIATFSGCPTYRDLYASGKPHDVYLYVAAKIIPGMFDRINEVYNIAAPTKESVAAAKKAFKRERTLAKPVHLSAAYNAGARKMYQQLRLAGEPVTLAEVQEMRQRYWGPELFGAVKIWERALQQEREERGGWIYNAHGRPLCVPEHRVKDLCNVFAQSSGHDCLLTYSWYLDRFRRERGVPMTPWLPNQHDAATWQVPEARVADAVQVFEDAYTALNRDLGNPEIVLNGEILICDNYWEAKCS